MTQTLSLRVDGYNIKQNTSSIILHLELKLLDKYKNAKFLTATEKKTIWQLLHIFLMDIVGKDREAVASSSLKPNL